MAAWRDSHKKEEKEALEQKLHLARQQLDLLLTSMTRYENEQQQGVQ